MTHLENLILCGGAVLCCIACSTSAMTAVKGADRGLLEAPPRLEDGNSFRLHEWGLVRYLGGRSGIVTSRHLPAFPIDDVQPEKPIIYLHADPGWNHDQTVEVILRAPTMALREVWPREDLSTQPAGEREYAWRPVIIEKEGCDGTLAPAKNSRECASLDDGGVCEAAEMSLFMKEPVPHCLRVGINEIRSPALVYNGALVRGSRVPVQAFPDGSVKNVSRHRVGPLWIRGRDGVIRVDMLEASKTRSRANADAVFSLDDHDALRKDIKSTLIETGLTPTEARHFMGAWLPDVLSDEMPWRALGFFSREFVDATWELHVTPAPREVVRAMLFSLE